MPPTNADTSAVLPSPEQRLPLPIVDAPHPAIWDLEDLMPKCDFRMQSRGGPGGQHRNRTASGVFVTYRPAEITAEATEQRDQHRNRGVAVRRLRYALAVTLRTPSPLSHDVASRGNVSATANALEQAVRERYHASSLKLAEDNQAKPGLIALLLNDLHVAGGQPSLVAPLWGVSTSRIVAVLRSHHPALTLVNRIRGHHKRGPLK